MKKRTKRAPLIFEHEDSKFRTTSIGFLEADEILFKYLPDIIKLTEAFGGEEDEEGNTSVNIGELLGSLPKTLITDVCNDLLVLTEYFDEENGYEPLDPNEFDTNGECFAVIWKVFQYNYPDFFGSEEGTDQPDSTPKPKVKKGLMDKLQASSKPAKEVKQL